MGPGKKLQGLQSYRAPLTGHETHKSGFEATQQRIFEKKEAEYLLRLKNVKPMIDFSAPKSTQMKHVGANLKRREMDFQRYSAIERENFRLLDRMSKIMVRDASHSIMGVHDSQNNFPALYALRSRELKAKQMDVENKVILKRIVNTKPYYSSEEWERHAQKTYEFIGKMYAPKFQISRTPIDNLIFFFWGCLKMVNPGRSKYPNQVFVLRDSMAEGRKALDMSTNSGGSSIDRRRKQTASDVPV